MLMQKTKDIALIIYQKVRQQRSKDALKTCVSPSRRIPKHFACSMASCYKHPILGLLTHQKFSYWGKGKREGANEEKGSRPGAILGLCRLGCTIYDTTSRCSFLVPLGQGRTRNPPKKNMVLEHRQNKSAPTPVKTVHITRKEHCKIQGSQVGPPSAGGRGGMPLPRGMMLPMGSYSLRVKISKRV